MKLATASLVAFLSEIASTHFVKYSVVTRSKCSHLMVNGWADKIKPLGMEMPWCAHVLQAYGMGMDEVRMRLIGVATFNKLSGVPLHRRPIIPCK